MSATVINAPLRGDLDLPAQGAVTPVLSVLGLAKYYQLHLQGGLITPVLSDVEFQVLAGECLALTGPSGAGKSTLLRCLVGNARAQSGAIWLARKAPLAPINLVAASERELLRARRDYIAWVSQFLRVIPRVPAIELVMEPLQQEGLDAPLARARAEALLERLKLPSRLWNLPPATFSGGEQQRVNLARGLICPRALLLLDEPTASLDQENRDRVLELILEARNAGTAVVGIFHDSEVRAVLATKTLDVRPLVAPINHPTRATPTGRTQQT